MKWKNCLWQVGETEMGRVTRNYLFGKFHKIICAKMANPTIMTNLNTVT